MSETANAFKLSGNGRLSSAGSVGMTPPRSPAMNRVPSAFLIKEVETPPSPSKWQRQHEQTFFRQLSFQRDAKKLNTRASKEKAQKLARKIPTEMLAREWMNDNEVTLDARAFLVENILPTLILGVEKLLMEADKLELANKTESDPNFNPINYLAQYLMRNNPRYSNLSEASPYVKSLREVGEALKAQIFELEDNKLAKIKNEARRKREERERLAEQKKLERVRRKEALEEQFTEWTDTAEGRVELALVQSALKSFAAMVEYLPEDLQPMAKYSQEIDSADDSGKTLVQRDFVEYLTNFVDDYPAPLFDQFVAHLNRCSAAYHSEQARELRKATLSNIFIMCDNSGIGVLDRHRILSLFESFYDQQSSETKQTMKLRNPRKWPVVEVDEADSESEDEGEVTSPVKAAETQSNAAVSADTLPTDAEKPEARPSSAEEKHEDEATEKTAAPPVDSNAAEVTGTAEPTGESAEVATAASAVDEANAEGPAAPDVLPDDKEESRDQVAPLGQKREPTRAGAFSVSFAEGTNLERERTMLTTRGTGSQSQMSAFDENTINMSQFIQLTETFLGDYPVLEIFQSLCRYMRNGYVETEEEKMTRLMKAHREVQQLKQRQRIDNLFERWDNEGSGYLEIEEVETIAHKYKDGLERQAINRAKYRTLQKAKQATGQTDTRLTKSEFRDLIYTICDEIPGDNTFEFFVDFVESCVERTYAEKIRGEARKKWLSQIITSADTSAASLETVYRSVFQALYRDAETHGGGKVISANIAMHEQNNKEPARGEYCLRYIAATSDDSAFLLNQVLYKDMPGISFAAVESGKPLHVPRVSNHGNIHFFNPNRAEDDRDGSFVVIPLKDKRKRVFGTLGVDTLRDPHTKSIFITHEIQFYQGISKAFSISYHKVDSKRKTLRITESAISWICRRSEFVHEINVYLVEPDGKDEDYVLRRMMLAQGEKDVKTFYMPSRLERKDNLFRDYLFKCVDNSDTVTADAYGQRHFAFPLRGGDGRAIAVIDISTGEVKAMPKHERREILRMLKLVQKAQKEINKESLDGERTMVLEAEKENEDVRIEVMFDRLMLMDLRKNVAKLDVRAYAELKSYKDPPQVIHNILKSTLSLFYPEKAKKKEFDDWGACKMLINSELNNKIVTI
ncbi:hypothetical protein EB796_011528 [Bugula neritina]|uniref:EF-hand domain-containing protein n=1 Tax=Bugula neritina TaxID=10212 RepID=A0A7J7JUU8_BUGNE|nr:hypothetical protein EB796_011528 [Bugula neritina]